MAEPGTNVKVEIFDLPYNLRGSDAEHVRRLAAYVDAKMRAVAQHTSTVNSLRVAVLAALNIADELFALRSGQGKGAGQHSERAEHLCKVLDAALEEAMREPRRTE